VSIPSSNYQSLPTIDAVASIAGTHLGTTGAKFDQIDPNAQVGAIENAIETGAGKLGQIQDIRQAVAMKADDPNNASLSGPVQGAPSGATAQILKAGAYLGLGFVVPPVAAAMAVVEGVKWATSSVNNGVHEHAALVSGPSSFKSFGTGKRGDDPAAQYTDTSGDSYSNGIKTAAPAIQPQQRPGAAPNPYLGAAAEAVKGRDPNQLDKEMGGIVTAEKKLLDQVAAGQEAARDKFGVDSPALQVQKPTFSTGPRPGFFG
jgi:hypothetical protein